MHLLWPRGPAPWCYLCLLPCCHAAFQHAFQSGLSPWSRGSSLWELPPPRKRCLTTASTRKRAELPQMRQRGTEARDKGTSGGRSTDQRDAAARACTDYPALPTCSAAHTHSRSSEDQDARRARTQHPAPPASCTLLAVRADTAAWFARQRALDCRTRISLSLCPQPRSPLALTCRVPGGKHQSTSAVQSRHPGRGYHATSPRCRVT